MNFHAFARSAAAALLVVFIGAAQAAVLFSQPPLPGINGLQADASTGPLAQTFTVAPGSTLDAIEWYGYHLPGSFGPAFDAFTVLVNGLDVSIGAGLSTSIVFSAGGFDLVKYTLNIIDVPINSGQLELSNGLDTQWAWQYHAVGAALQAFTLIGAAANVPEPGTAALWLLALAACARAGRRNQLR